MRSFRSAVIPSPAIMAAAWSSQDDSSEPGNVLQGEVFADWEEDVEDKQTGRRALRLCRRRQRPQAVLNGLDERQARRFLRRMVDPVTTGATAGALVGGGWVAKKLLGPTLETIGDDLQKLYAAGRDRIVNRAAEKVDDLDDGKCANLRVARDVLWNGAFSESEVCTEYYSGLLAASRSADGLDDEAAPFVDVVKSLASRQLKLHYSIYRSLERILEQAHANGETFDVSAIHGRMDVFFTGHDPHKSALDLQVLLRNGLIAEFATDSKMITRKDREWVLLFCKARPTMFGISLYAAAHNQLEWWQAFGLRHFGEFGDIEPPKIYGQTMEELLDRAP